MFPTPKHVPASDQQNRLKVGALAFVMFVLAGLHGPNVYSTTLTVTSAVDNGLPGSLRFAVESATSGDVVSIETSGQISVTNGCIQVPGGITIQSGTSGQVTISGVSISQLFCITAGTVTFADLHFADAWATGGSVIRASNATVELDNCVAYGNRASNGSVVYATGSNIVISDSHFYDNYVHGTGGAVYVYNCDMSVNNSTFATNRAGVYGGAIYAHGYVTIASCQFVSNQSTCAGAAIFFDENFLDISNSQFRHNVTEDEGGAILAVDRMNVTSSTFEYNRSTNSGGAIRYVGDKLNVSHSTFANNSTGRNGGGLRLTGVVVITSSTIVNNSSTRSGAGLAHFDGLLFLHSTRFEDNRSSTHGGAVLAPGEIEVTSCSFVNNYAQDLGGGIFQGQFEGSMYVEDSRFTENRAGSAGGGIFAGNSIVLITTSTVTNNHAENDDGGGLLADFCLVDIGSSTFANNTAHERGGGVYVHDDSDLLIYDSQFDSNIAGISGGGAYANEGTLLEVVNSRFTSNRATLDNGGGFRQDLGDEIYLVESLFGGNVCGNSGGAGKFSAEFSLVTSCTIINNEAADNGGGLRVSYSGPEISQTTFANNRAQDGGAAWGLNSGLFFVDCDMHGNLATNSGGAVAVWTDVELEFEPFDELELPPFSLILMRRCTVTNNSAAIDGGALHLETGVADVAESRFAYNSSTRNGAVVFSTSGSIIEFAANVITSNTAGVKGGALYLQNTFDSFVDVCEIHDNSAGVNGGAVYVTNSTLSIGWTTIATCTAGNNGGAIFVHANSTTNVTSCTIRNNLSTMNGGAVYNSSGRYSSTGATYHDNQSGSFGGAVYNRSTALFNNNTFSANLADGHGGAIYTTSPLVMTSNTLTLNVADNDDNGSGHGGGMHGPGSGVRSNIIAGNIDRGGEFPDVAGSFSSSGYNLIGNLGNFNLVSNTTGDRYGDPNSTTSPSGSAIESSTAIDPELSALADNGGPTFTHALELASPAINTGAPTGLRNRDQRENVRYGQPDIGAFEALPPLIIVGSTTACIDADLTYGLQFFSTSNSYSWESNPGGADFEAVSPEGEALVLISEATIATLTVTETFMDGSSRATSIVVSSFPIVGQMDYACVTAGNTVTFNVLTNDNADGISIQSLINTEHLNGTVSWVSAGTVTYTAATGFSGFETFSYIADGESLCTSVTVNVVIAVKPGEEPPINLTYIERKKDRKGGVRGLRRVSDVKLSSDGNYVFASGWSDHSVVMMSRNANDGTLSYLGRARHNYNGVSKMRYPSAIALSPDERVLYVTSYADHSLLVFNIDYDNDKLEFHKVLCPNTGGTQMKNPTDVVASSDGRSVYVAAYGGSAIAHFESPTSSATNINYIGRYVDGVDGVDGLKNAMGLAASPDGKMVYVAGEGDKALAIFKRSRNDGTLEFQRRFRDGINGVDGLAGASAVAVSPDNKSVYVSAYSDRAVAVFKTDLNNCEVSFTGRFKDGQNGVDGLNGAYDVRVSDDGTTVYVVGELDNAVAMFKRSLSDCSLSYVECLKDNSGGVDGLKRVRAVAASNDSRHVYCAGRNDNAVSAFLRNRAPDAQDDVEFVFAGATETITVLSNDSDPDGDALSITSKTDGAFGTVTISGGGSQVEYQVPTPFVPDSFTYTISDGNGGTSTATVTLQEISVKGIVGAEADAVQGEAWLSVNLSPNPVSETAEITVVLSQSSHVELSVVNISGQVVYEFPVNKLDAGSHSLKWETRDASGAPLLNGTYWLKAMIRNADGTVRNSSLALKVIR